MLVHGRVLQGCHRARNRALRGACVQAGLLRPANIPERMGVRERGSIALAFCAARSRSDLIAIRSMVIWEIAMKTMLLGLLALLSAARSVCPGGCRCVLQGQDGAHHRRRRCRIGLRHQRAPAGAPSRRAYSRQPGGDRAEPAWRRQPDHDQSSSTAPGRSTAPRSAPRSTDCRPRRCSSPRACASRRPGSTTSAAPTAKPRSLMSGTPHP